MHNHIALEWVARLRSGDYAQGKHNLCQVGDGQPDKFCCLGVLCEMYMDYNETDNSFAHDLSRSESSCTVGCHVRTYDKQVEFLPDSVMKWAGMNNNSGQFTVDKAVYNLSSMNDDGADFHQIADAIDLHWQHI